MGYIERVIVHNLPHRLDRKFFMTGHLHTVGVPPSQLEFYPCEYHGDYESAESIIETAVSDGFDEFGNEQFKRWLSAPHAKFMLVRLWMNASVFRKVAASDVNTLVMIDDAVLYIKFSYLSHIVCNLCEDFPPFYCFQITHFINANDEKWMMKKGLNNYEPPDILNGFVARGFGGMGNTALVLSPQGASIMLEDLLERACCTENQPADFMKNRDIKGFFHALEPLASHAPVDWNEDSIDVRQTI